MEWVHTSRWFCWLNSAQLSRPPCCVSPPTVFFFVDLLETICSDVVFVLPAALMLPCRNAAVNFTQSADLSLFWKKNWQIDCSGGTAARVCSAEKEVVCMATHCNMGMALFILHKILLTCDTIYVKYQIFRSITASYIFYSLSFRDLVVAFSCTKTCLCLSLGLSSAWVATVLAWVSISISISKEQTRGKASLCQ